MNSPQNPPPGGHYGPQPGWQPTPGQPPYSGPSPQPGPSPRPGSSPQHGQAPIPHYGETQLNPVSQPGPGFGTPPPMGPPPMGPPGTPPGPAPQAPPPGQQFPPGGQWPTPAEQFTGSAPPPSGGSKKVVWISVAAVLVVAAIVAGVVTFLLLRDDDGKDGDAKNDTAASSSSTAPEPSSETFTLNDGVSVEIVTPDDWNAYSMRDGNNRLVLFTHSGSGLTDGNFEDELDEFGDPGGRDEMHFATLESLSCQSSEGPRPTSDTWKTHDMSTAPGVVAFQYGRTIDSDDCLFLTVGDFSTTGSRPASDAVNAFDDPDSVVVDVTD